MFDIRILILKLPDYCKYYFATRLLTQKHTTISSISNGVDMRWNFITLLSLVQFNNLLCVDRQTLVWVNDNTE